MVRNVADIYQSEQYSLAAQKVKRAQGALNILSNSGKNGQRDMLHISDTGRTYSKEHVVALVDTAVNLSTSDFSFYFDHYNNMPALLEAINFSEGFVTDSYNPELSELGVLSFKIGGVRQYIPNYAIPKINAGILPTISAKNNQLILDNRGYYCYTAKNGKNYTWTVHEGHIGWAKSESMAEAVGENTSGYNYRWEMHRAGDLLSRLAKGSSTYGFSNEEQKEILAGFGITEGHFTIDAGAGTHHYMLLENGVVIDIDKRMELMNKTNWHNQGYQTGEVINVYGKECVIGEDGHIQVSAEDGFTDTKIQYPDGKTL
ncbi:MAG: hypothetical protein J6B68_11715 [Lachnospiraceae bacterium]|nr:hypothetical protein [Lachnospiraceae bacterium]